MPTLLPLHGGLVDLTPQQIKGDEAMIQALAEFSQTQRISR
ncbi:MAG: hypothetical protein ACYTXT_06425 [Nostoc sp.]